MSINKYNRRSFLTKSIKTFGATEFALLGIGGSELDYESINNENPERPARTFDHLNQILAGDLDVGYVDTGPPEGRVVILLHGWPYDIHSFVDVTPILTSAGYRVIIPYLRGYGTTLFISDVATRNGQQSAFAQDIINLMDALKIKTAIVAGFDWGARTANIIAALWPNRCKAMVSVSGYLIGNPEINKMPLLPKAELEWWYQFYFSTERGREGYKRFCETYLEKCISSMEF